MKKNKWLDQYTQQHKNNILQNTQIYPGSGITNGFSKHFSSVLPIIQKVSAHMIGMGGTKKSEIQQLRENRLNKIRQIEGKNPNVILPDDENVPGLVSVQPMSAPKGSLMYIDYKYGDIKEERKMKLEEIKKNQKILKILEMLKNNI